MDTIINSHVTGIILVNKPAGPTSFGCVGVIKKLLPKKTKVGHAGTLDDFASGLLIICVGRQATRQVPQFMGLDKEYVVRAKLGEMRDSLDRTGKIIQIMQYEHVTADTLIQAMKSLQPSYLQIPPIYSALKFEGQPLYKLARHDLMSTEELEKIVQQKGKTVQIKEIELLSFEPPFFIFRVLVSKGTYARSVANDIAQKLNTCATTYDLERTAIGDFCLTSAVAIGELKSIDDVAHHCMSLQF